VTLESGDTIDKASVDTVRARRRSFLKSWFYCEGESVPLRSSWPTPLRTVRTVGLLIILIGFIGLALWSSFLASRFSLTNDYSFYGQAWYLIAHGHLDPYSTIFPPSFWHNAFELVMWPLAGLWFVWPHAVTLLWVQDAATAATEAMLFVWMCEVTAVAFKRGRLHVWPALFPACGLILLVASPWTIWINSFDFHPEALDLLLAVLAAHAFWRGRGRRGWIFALLALGAGALGASYIVGVGISALLAGRRWRRVGATLIVVSIMWLLLVSRLGGDQAAGVYTSLATASHVGSLSALSLLRAIVEHPSRVMATIWAVRTDVLADISSGGIVGLFSPWTFGITILTLFETSLTGYAQFAEPYVQNNLPAVLLVPLGTIWICVALATSRQRWRRVVAMVLAGLAVANIVGWSIVWTPRTEGHWVSVSPSAAVTLDRALAMISPNDEVIVSQGVEGLFSFRQWIYPFFGNPPASFPIQSRTIWFIVAPTSGVELQSPSAAQSEIQQITKLPRARLMLHSGGIYVFRWKAPPLASKVAFRAATSVPAWALSSASSRRVLVGPVDDWHVEGGGKEGYVVDGDYWHANAGELTATVRLATNGPVNVEIWDLTSDVLLARAGLNSTAGIVKTITVPADLIRVPPASAFAGPWPFRVQPVAPPRGNVIEIRIWSPGKINVSVYSLELSGPHLLP